MQRALACLILTLLPIASAAANAPHALSFNPPGAAGGLLEADAVKRVLIVMPETGGTAHASVTLEGGRFENFTLQYFAAYGGGVAATQPVWSTDSVQVDWRALDIVLAPRFASIYVEASEIVLSEEADALIHSGSPLLITSYMDLSASETRTFREFDDAREEVYLVSMSGTGSLSVRGLRKLAWFDADLQCTGGSSPCPGGGGERIERHEVTPGAGVLIDSYYYESVQTKNGTLEMEFSGAKTLAGGPRIDVAVDGWLRLPLASGDTSCATCRMPEDQTLTAEGRMSLHQMEGRGGRVHAGLEADATSLRYDEEPVSPSVLSVSAPVAAASVAVGGLVVGLKLLLAGLFTRRKKDPLDHPRRKLIHDYVCAHPGASFREVARKVGLSSGTARHHLSQLKRAGLLVEHPFRSSVRFFENHGKYAKNWREKVLLRDPALALLGDWLRDHPGAPQKDILDAMQAQGWSRSTTQHRLGRLVAEDLAHVTPSGRLLYYHPGPKPSAGIVIGASRSVTQGAAVQASMT